ncbi:hypothetical protein AMI01nite_56190 [Aneurinibacillus migulanus]|nr:hypothetical protein AMI01nite_56190 [Aneurinibacillus migulanus]
MINDNNGSINWHSCAVKLFNRNNKVVSVVTTFKKLYDMLYNELDKNVQQVFSKKLLG